MFRLKNLFLAVCSGYLYLKSAIAAERSYVTTVTITDLNRGDEGTAAQLWFRIGGEDDTYTEWYVSESDELTTPGETYDLERSLSDISGDIQTLTIVKLVPDAIIMDSVSVDSTNTFEFSSSGYSMGVVGYCCHCDIVEINFVDQSYEESYYTNAECPYEWLRYWSTPAPTMPSVAPTNEPSPAPSAEPTPSPSKMPTGAPVTSASDCDYTHTCTAWGDPHITTFDGTLYHFQGAGYFDYVKSCYEDSSISSLPFTISARHKPCNGNTNSFTCVSEVIVTMNDDSGYVFSFPNDASDPTFKNIDNSDETTTSAVGSYTLTDGSGSYTIAIRSFEITFDYEDEHGNYIDAAIFKFYYRGNKLTIETTDCLLHSNICGLCGYLNDDSSDDWIRCDTLEMIDNTDASIGYSDDTVWDNTHLFGESCCNAELDTYLFEWEGEVSDCTYNPGAPSRPDEECLDEAKVICQDVWDLYCGECDSDNESGLSEASDEWIGSCAMDVCTHELCTIDDIYSLDMETAIENGCLDTTINECLISKYYDIISVLA